MKRLFFFFLAIALSLAIASALHAANSSLLAGKKAPPFRAESGDGKVVDATMLRGYVVVLFYESKDVIDKSRPIKKVLNSFYDEQAREVQQMIARVPIINCTSAAWPFTGIWKSRLVENSKRVGMTVYGDWDGKMGTSYGMNGDDTNLVIIDKKGFIRFFRTGAITGNGEAANLLKKLLKDLVTESP